MDMIPGLILILATALLSSVLTLLLGQAFLQQRLEAKLAEAANRLREGVKDGVTDAGRDLLPGI